MWGYSGFSTAITCVLIFSRSAVFVNGFVSPLILTLITRDSRRAVGEQVRLVAESLKKAPRLPLEPYGSRVMTQTAQADRFL